MTEFAQALLAMGIVGTFSALAGCITIKIAEHICEEAEKQEDDYVYMEDGPAVKFNEDDQE